MENGEYVLDACYFNTEGGDLVFGTKTTYASDGTTIRYLTLSQNGVVVEGSNMPENRLEPTEDLVTLGTSSNGNPTINFHGFNFKNMFCGPIFNNQNQITGWEGRKLVIAIPLEPSAGIWGDGISTNGPLSFVMTTQNGQTITYGFNSPTANIIGSVWTEVVSGPPTDFDPMNIDSPEDLAWFVSKVNGRIHYLNGDTVASKPNLNGRLTADIDMSAHNWVPIGAGYKVEKVDPDDPDSETQFVTVDGKRVILGFEGTFDGNGHVITGLKNNADKWYKTASGDENEVVVFPGMFSNIGSNGVVHDVFILDSDFRGKYHVGEHNELAEKFVYHGILADTLTGGTIYNCEAAGRMTCNNDVPTNDANLIYGGLVGLNDGGTIYNSMAMAQLSGYTMGGAVGENRNGSFSNGFTNGVYDYIGEDGTNSKEVGGLAAINKATIENCYVRFERANNNLSKAKFGQLVGNNTSTSTLEYCYYPESIPSSLPEDVVNTGDDPSDSDAYTEPVSPTRYYYYMNDNQVGGEWTTIGGYNIYSGGTTLAEQLNTNKGTTHADWAEWKRTTAGRYNYGVPTGYVAGNINRDYPVLQFSHYKCLASTDGVSIDYAAKLSDMLHRHNTGNISENSATYGLTSHEAIYGGAINLYANEDMNPTNNGGNGGNGKDGEVNDYSTADNVVVFIDENISLLQPTDAIETPSSIEAYTGQTLKSFRVGDEGERWHNVSSSLENSYFGISYKYDNVPHAWGPDWAAWQASHTDSKPKDPCVVTLSVSDEDHALFPTDMSNYHWFDFYCFYEPEYHWINFKRNSNSHWHMDNYTTPIDYNNELTGEGNETQFVPVKGYLLSVDMSYYEQYYTAGYDKDYQFLQNRGTLNNGPVNITVTAEGPAWTGLQGYNLLGNPYQSFLDFNKFVEGQDEGFWTGSKFSQTCAVYDPSTGTYLQTIPTTPSQGAQVAGPTINMHQGFFIQVGQNGTAHFTNAMRTNEGTPNFRGAQPAYPLVNFTLTDSEGNKDIAVLEIARPENDGAKKLRMGSSTGRISLRHDNENCAILFRDMTEGSQPLYFDADEDGMFTLSWNTANADFRELTLVDNITGVRYDMLSHDSYVFEGHANDYKSRFKVVIGSFTGVEEEETVTNNFAFFDGSEWVVNGQGRLTVTDMMGRMVYSANLENDQNRVNLNGVAQGMYLMQVSNSDGSRVQKIVVR